MEILERFEHPIEGETIVYEQDGKRYEYNLIEAIQTPRANALRELIPISKIQIKTHAQFQEMESSKDDAARTNNEKGRIKVINSQLEDFGVSISSTDEISDAKAFLTQQRAARFAAAKNIT